MKSKKTIMKEIEDLIAYEQDGKEINNWKFGVELEYGGYSNRIEYSREDENNLIETIKSDGSVAGDGTEYNLKPISFEDIKTKKMVRNLESFCYRVANKRCTISSTAGMHIHFSWDKEYGTTDGREMGQILTNIARWLFYDYSDKYRLKTLIENNNTGREPRIRLKYPVDAIEWVKDEDKKQTIEMMKKLYDAFQFLYSVSNRDGTESYGLGTNYTRGYTAHGTLELRCWRTSYDYREILARIFVARFFLQYILRIGLYEKNGLIEEIADIETIWQMLNKNEKLKSMYEYLAYNVRNKHKTGLPLHILMANLKTYDTGYVTEIKKRSDVYTKSLIKDTSARKAKEMFETIINFEEKGEEDESRV